MYQIYKITNKINNMVYIGSSIDVKRRWRNHKEAAINQNDHHYNYPLMKAFREFGIANFTFEIVETVNNFKEMINAEYNWIIKENCIIPYGYNQTSNTESPMFDPVIAKKMSDTKRKKYGKKVCEINENKEIIGVWDSIAEVGEKTGLDRYKISSVCNGQRLTTGGRIFRFINEKGLLIEPIAQMNKAQINRITKTSKKVNMYDMNDNFIQSFDSIALAAKFCNGDASCISAVCRGKRNSHKNYKWRYKENE